jgi:hypothetical protein
MLGYMLVAWNDCVARCTYELHTGHIPRDGSHCTHRSRGRVSIIDKRASERGQRITAAISRLPTSKGSQTTMPSCRAQHRSRAGAFGPCRRPRLQCQQLRNSKVLVYLARVHVARTVMLILSIDRSGDVLPGAAQLPSTTPHQLLALDQPMLGSDLRGLFEVPGWASGIPNWPRTGAGTGTGVSAGEDVVTLRAQIVQVDMGSVSSAYLPL